jgi:hypothetical protein
MVNNNENYEDNNKYAGVEDENKSNSDKITVHIDKNDTRIYRKDDDNDNKLTPITTDHALNPFTFSINMWQNYAKIWTDVYRQLFFKNQPMTNGEFLFMYYRSDSKSKE